jgi:ketosteroid isomerase-like protein
MTLRRFACSLLFASTLSVPAALVAQSVPDQLHTLTREELDVIKVLTKQEDNWNGGNLDAFATGYKNSPEILFIGRQISRGYDQMLADYKKGYPTKEAMGTLSFSGLEPHLLDEHYAVVVGHYRVDRSKKAGGMAEGIFSLVLEKTPEGWKIVVDHTTS